MTTEPWQARAHRSLDATAERHEARGPIPLGKLLAPYAEKIGRAKELPAEECDEPVECARCDDAGWVKRGDGSLRLCRCPVGIGAALADAGVAGRELEQMSLTSFRPQDADQRALLAAAHAFVAEPRGFLTLAGDRGRGKTHVAVGIVRAMCERGIAGRFTTVPDMLDGLQRASLSDEVGALEHAHRRLAELPLLVLDDLGAEKGTAFKAEQVFRAINGRYNRQAATVVTTNLDLDELDPRVADRLIQWEVVVTSGESVRATGVAS